MRDHFIITHYGKDMCNHYFSFISVFSRGAPFIRGRPLCGLPGALQLHDGPGKISMCTDLRAHHEKKQGPGLWQGVETHGGMRTAMLLLRGRREPAVYAYLPG